MSKKTGLPQYVRWHQGRLRFQHPRHFEGRAIGIKAEPDSREFDAIYARLLIGELPEDYKPRLDRNKPNPSRSARGAKGTLRWGIDEYLLAKDREGAFTARVRAKKVRMFNQLCESRSAEHPDQPPRGQWQIADFEKPNIQAYLAELEADGGVGRWNLHFDAIKPLFAWFNSEIRDGKPIRRTLSPLHGMRRKPYIEKDPNDLRRGRKRVPTAWQQKHFDAYRARWPVGADDPETFGKARLVLEIVDGLWIRRSDVARLGPQHLVTDADGEVWWELEEFKGARTEDPKRRRFRARYTPELMEALQGYLSAYKRYPVADPRCERVFLTYRGNGSITTRTDKGWRELPYVSATDGEPHQLNKHFARWVAAAGMPRRFGLHAIRRGAPVIAAHEGDDVNAIRAKLGHRRITQTMKYLQTQLDDRLADNQMRDALERRQARRTAPTPAGGAVSRPKLRVVA
ncbi:MAG TPA: hypothetical protein VKY24_24010 [Reyranella sp.]|nr:hypothetical protein [Reyranella sp.]